MKSKLYMREYIGFESTLDRLTYVIVELRLVPMEFWGRVSRAFSKLGYTCKTIKAQTIRIQSKKRLCVGVK